MSKTIFNSALLSTAREQLKEAEDGGTTKEGFVDPATAGAMDPMAAGGGAPPGGDPMAMGGDPMAMGGDPMAAAGGAPPPAPDTSGLEQRLMALESQLASGGAGGGMAGGVEPIKPKIDINIEVMKMNKMLARIADHMGIQIPASDMVATSDDLTQMGMEQETAGAGGAPPPSAIQPPAPIDAAAPAMAAMGGGGGGEKASTDRTTGYAGEAYLREDAPAIREVGGQAAALARTLRSQT